MGKLLNFRLFDLIFVLFLVPLNFGLPAIADVFVTNSLGFCKLLCCVYSLPSLLAGITAVIFVKRTVLFEVRNLIELQLSKGNL